MRRGDVFRLRLGRRQGHEQSGVRYGVIVQSEAQLRLSTVLMSTSARAASLRPEIDIEGTPTRILIEQTGAVDVTRLDKYHGHLTTEALWGVDLALDTVFGLH